MLSKKAAHMVRYLKGHRFHENCLYQRSLLNHLLRTYSKLKQWGNTDDVALVGLCHSIYEDCEGYPQRGLKIKCREQVRNITNDKSEYLAYLFSLCEYNQSITALFKYGRNYVIRGDNHKKVYLSKADSIVLLEVSAANMVEQIEYLFRRLTPYELKKYLNPYASANKYLSARAVNNINYLLIDKIKELQ